MQTKLYVDQLALKVIIIILSINHVMCIEYYDVIYKYIIDYGSDNYENINKYKYFDKNKFYTKKNKQTEQCIDGKIIKKYQVQYENIHTRCTIFYKYENSNNGYNCIKCPDGQIASFENSHNKTLCNISFNDYEKTQIEYIVDYLLNKYEEKNCNELLKDSIGREVNTPPIVDYCQCPKNMPRVEFICSNKIKKYYKYHCLSQELALKYISSDKLDYTIVYFLDKITENYQNLIYRNCNPNRTTDDLIFLCLCPPMHIYSNGKCKKCTDSEPNDHDKQMKCIKCPRGKLLTLDGKGCMCPYSDEPQSEDCNEATENEKFCSGNLVLNDGKCKPCLKNKIKSKITGKCICPEGKYINSCYTCVDCTDGLTTNDIDQTFCICPKGKYIDSSSNCVDCTNGFTTNDINETSCFCPNGRYINSDENCIECSKGKFSTTINSIKCNTCTFFKTTENTESKSPSQCNKINYLHLFTILGIIGLIIFLCFSVTLFIVKKKTKKKNFNNQNRNQAVTDSRYSKKSTNESKMSKQPQQESYVNYESSKVPIYKINSGPHEYLNQIDTSKEEKNSKSKENFNVSNQKNANIVLNNEDIDDYQNAEITKIHLKKINNNSSIGENNFYSMQKNDLIKCNKSDSIISQEVNENKISKKLDEEEVYESCGLDDIQNIKKDQK